jgi:hypothetical protein
LGDHPAGSRERASVSPLLDRRGHPDRQFNQRLTSTVDDPFAVVDGDDGTCERRISDIVKYRTPREVG